MIETYGNGDFENAEFLFRAWPANFYQSEEEIKTKIDSIGVIGQRLTGFHATGRAESMINDSIAETVYYLAEQISPEERNGVPSCEYYDPDLLCDQLVSFDEPMVLLLENGVRLEMDMTNRLGLRISANTIPEDFADDVNYNPNKLFNRFIGLRITGLEIHTIPKEEDLYEIQGDPRDIVDRFALVFEDGNKLLWVDDITEYTYVLALDSENNRLQIRLEDLEKAGVPELKFETYS